MDLLYLGNFDFHQWFLSRIENPVVIVNPLVDLLFSGNFGIHQWFLSRIRNHVVVLLVQK